MNYRGLTWISDENTSLLHLDLAKLIYAMKIAKLILVPILIGNPLQECFVPHQKKLEIYPKNVWFDFSEPLDHSRSQKPGKIRFFSEMYSPKFEEQKKYYYLPHYRGNHSLRYMKWKHLEEKTRLEIQIIWQLCSKPKLNTT